MNQKILENLIKFGLSDTEARVYCAALALEEAAVDKISRKAGVNRTSAYPILERLKNLGLISQIKKKGKTVFKAERPEKFLHLLEEKKESINAIIPDLKSLFDISRGRPDVRFYEGREGLKTVLNSILNEAKEVCIFGESESFIKAIPGWTEAYVEKRAKRQIKVRMILRATPYAVQSIKKINSSHISQYLKVRMLPEAYRSDYSGFDIFNNKVVLYTFEKQNTAVVIENSYISKMMGTVFEILWEVAGRYEHLLD
jgi:sugar-specific transcriptional regulator TrmB